jgi:hypothetical protein
MPDIHVVIPSAGKMSVANDPESVVSKRRLEWNFISFNPDVDRVRIEFEPDDAKIFNVNGTWQNWFEKKLGDPVMVPADPPRFERRATIWGNPENPSVERAKGAEKEHPTYISVRNDLVQTRPKYTITLKNGDKVIDVLDPKIIIDDPDE